MIRFKKLKDVFEMVIRVIFSIPSKKMDFKKKRTHVCDLKKRVQTVCVVCIQFFYHNRITDSSMVTRLRYL